MRKFILLTISFLTLNFSMEAKTLVAYFSATGTTKAVAEQIAQATNGTLFAIEPAVPYTQADLDWQDKKSRSTLEMNDPNARPEMKKGNLKMADFEVVYLGFPIWWYVAPRIINTFLETYDCTGKTIIPFATSGGSTIPNCTNALRKTYPKLTFEDGRLLNRVSYKEIEEWVAKK